MNSNLFQEALKKNKIKVVNYLNDQAPGMVIRKTLRFIDGNFRAQGWQGSSFVRWAKNSRNGTILVKNGFLRRGFNYNSLGGGTVRFYNNMPYANAHNRGFTGTVNIKEHTRSRYTRSKVMAINDFTKSGKRKTRTVTNKTGESKVKAYTREMKLPKRQFAPYEGNESPVMNKSISREIETEINKILKL